MSDDAFYERLSVAVSPRFQESVQRAASQVGLNVADFTRLALGAQMSRQGIRCPIAILHKPAPVAVRKRGGGQ
jgi:hypothetical protein